MKQQKMLNTNKGITLIALVITIIVMLILVAVTISIAVNGGLFDYAGKAVGDTQNAINAEKELANGRIKIGETWYDSIDDYINNNPIEIGIEVTPTEIALKKNETGAEGEEVLTGTITATVFGMEKEPKISWEKSSDAITLSATTGKSVTVTAVGTENATATVTAKCTYEGQEYTAECKVTLEIIEKPAITAATMQSNLASYLGQTVNYGVTYTDASSYGQGKWEIFYADGEHIYIITRGHLAEGTLTRTGYNGTSDFTAESVQTKYPAIAAGLLNKTYDPTSVGSELKYTNTNGNMQATQYLLDSEVELWESLADNDYAEWAIGAPTLELFVNSFNAYYPENAVTLENPTGVGYEIPFGSKNSVPSGTYLNHSTSTKWWLSNPGPAVNAAGVCIVSGYNSRVENQTYSSNGVSFRPVVCLDPDAQITWDSTTSAYTISWTS